MCLRRFYCISNPGVNWRLISSYLACECDRPSVHLPMLTSQVRHRVKPGPVCEANGGRCITLRCFSAWGGRPRGSTLAVADGSHSTQLVTGNQGSILEREHEKRLHIQGRQQAHKLPTPYTGR